MAEQLRNNAQTTLDGAINNSVTTLDVADASLFPTTGDFQIRIEDEIMRVTGVSGDTFTVIRGYESTTAASHADLDEVTQVVTTVGLDNYIGNFRLSGALSALPSPGLAGRIYYPDDSCVTFHDDGSEWHAIGPMYSFVVPELTDYTAYNQGGATFTQVGHGIHMNCPANASVDQMRCLYKARSAVSVGWKLTVAFDMWGTHANVRHLGLYLFDPISKRIEGVRVLASSHIASPTKQGIGFADPANGATTGRSVNTDVGYFGTRPLLHWLQIEQTGAATYTHRYSQNGIMWYNDFTTNAAVIFSNTPTDFLIGLSPFSGDGYATIRHVKEET